MHDAERNSDLFLRSDARLWWKRHASGEVNKTKCQKLQIILLYFYSL